MKKLCKALSIIVLVSFVFTVPQAFAGTDGSQPKLIVAGYTLDTDHLMSGENAMLIVSIHNTNNARSVRNIRLSISDSTNEILSTDTSSIIHSYIGPDKVYEWSVEVLATEAAKDAPHALTIKMEYEDKYGRTYVAEDTIIIDVIQPVRLEYSQVDMPVRVTQGDVFTLEMDLMNMGKGVIYNALLTYDIEGIANGGSVLVGNIDSGKTDTGKCNFRVNTDIVGEVTGNITLTYEDSRGRIYEEAIPVSTQIQEKVSVDFSQNETELTETDEFPWKTVAVVFILLSVVLIAICLVILNITRKLRRDYESKL